MFRLDVYMDTCDILYMYVGLEKWINFALEVEQVPCICKMNQRGTPR